MSGFVALCTASTAEYIFKLPPERVTSARCKKKGISHLVVVVNMTVVLGVVGERVVLKTNIDS